MTMIKHFNELFDPKHKSLKGYTWRILSPEEAAKARAEDARERNAHKLPPEAYTRFLLQAKEGDISGGEADRRIAKFGGHVSVRPLRKPPR
jgi:hypothetical protein